MTNKIQMKTFINMDNESHKIKKFKTKLQNIFKMNAKYSCFMGN